LTRKRGRSARWGQNFLVDRRVAKAIVEWAEIDGARVLEIGPGRGALTELLAERCAYLSLVEIDGELAEALRQRYAQRPAVEVIEGDVLEVDLSTSIEAPVRVVSNLPYESATAIVIRLLECSLAIESMVLMLQREVCRRILARAGDREYGRLALLVGLHADVEAGRVVKPGSFRPAPKVESQLLRIRPLPALRFDVGSMGVFRDLVRAAFGGRRKIVRNTLGPWLQDRIGPRARRWIEQAGIDPAARPETIELEAFARLSREVSVHTASADA